MRVRRHRSFRPTLDVLPCRIAPSVGATTMPADYPVIPNLYDDALYPDSTPSTMATPTLAVDPP